MARRKVSNPLGLAVLALLFERPMHPYEMASTLRERSKETSIKLNYGSLYTVIGALLKAGFIAQREKARAGARPERTVYALTHVGEVELHSWMRELLGTPVKEYPQFEAALSLMPILPPDEVVELLLARVEHLDADVASLRAGIEAASEQGVARLFTIENEYAIAMREAERAWVNKLLGLIRQSPSFSKQWRAMHAERRKKNGTNKRGKRKRT